MGRRHILPRHQVLDSEDTSLSIKSKSTDVSSIDVYAYDVTVDSTVNGLLSVEYTNNDDLTGWKTLDFGESTAVSGSSETDYRFQINTSFKFSRLSWSNAGGTGLISAEVFGLVRGA